MDSIALGLVFLISTNLTVLNAANPSTSIVQVHEKVLSNHDLDLTQREIDPTINKGFADNIELSLHYLKGDVGNLPINWNNIRQPFTVEFILNPGETFAFHDNVLPEFTKPKITMNSKFITTEGYLYVAGLGGNGVCHLATLINWAAKEAGLETVAKTSHDFAAVVGVPKEFGVSIMSTSSDQNLYIKNNKPFPVKFIFTVTQNNINLTVSQSN
jgi:hypothetical protein